MDIPIVDFKDLEGYRDVTSIENQRFTEIGAQVFEALANVGFVYLSNTGIPSSDIQDAFEVSKSFFDLPSHVKGKYKYDKNYSGYHGMCIESTNPERPPDFKESFHLGGMALSSKSHVWPDIEVHGFSTALAKLFGHCRTLSLKFLQVLALGMKLKDKYYFMKTHSRIGQERNYTTLRSLHYPPLSKEESLLPGQVRLGEHTDYGSFALLFQGEVGGLEIERPDGTYIEAKPIPGTVLVNIGDLLNLWSGGRLKSTKHRIRNPLDEAQCRKARQSIVCFVHPDFETELKELEFESNVINTKKRFSPVFGDRKCLKAEEYAEMRYNHAYTVHTYSDAAQ